VAALVALMLLKVYNKKLYFLTVQEMMIVSFLLIGWILSWFKFNNLFIQAFKELFNKEITIASYYFIFFCIGTIGDLILFIKGNYNVLFK